MSHVQIQMEINTPSKPHTLLWRFIFHKKPKVYRNPPSAYSGTSNLWKLQKAELLRSLALRTRDGRSRSHFWSQRHLYSHSLQHNHIHVHLYTIIVIIIMYTGSHACMIKHASLSFQVHFAPPPRRPTVATAPQRRRLGVDERGQYTYKKVLLLKMNFCGICLCK